MAKLSLVRDPKFREHVTPELHPESPQRLAAIDQALKRSNLTGSIKQIQPREASEKEILYVHESTYFEQLSEESQRANKHSALVPLDGDTFMSPDSLDTAKLAAGAGLAALDSLKGKEISSTFVAVRPPGHHALAGRAMGFCLFNNVAVAARYAQQELGYKKVAIIDWDVHHGNGTQDLFYDDPSVMFISFHQYPFWPPDSGWYTEVGVRDGKGFNLNIPLPAGTGDSGYINAWDSLVDPVVQEYEPDLILLSAGYDAHRSDPLAQQQITTTGYGMLSQRLKSLAEKNKAKLAGFLEGGYNVSALAESVLTTLSILNSDESGEEIDEKLAESVQKSECDSLTDDRNQGLVQGRIDELRACFSSYWKSLR